MAALVWVCAGVAQGFEIRVSPAQGESRAVPGGHSEFSFRLRSLGGEGRVRPNFGDFDLNEAGDPVSAKSLARSCAAWARPDRNELSLRTGGETELRVAVEVPATARGTYWCLLSLEVESLSSAAPRGNVVQVLPRISVPLLVTVAGGSPARLSAHFEKTEGSSQELSSSILLEGEGDDAVHLTGSVALEETSPRGPVETGRMVIPRTLVLPGHRRRVPVRFVRRSKAPVRLRGTLDYGDPEHKTVEIESGVAP